MLGHTINLQETYLYLYPVSVHPLFVNPVCPSSVCPSSFYPSSVCTSSVCPSSVCASSVCTSSVCTWDQTSPSALLVVVVCSFIYLSTRLCVTKPFHLVVTVVHRLPDRAFELSVLGHSKVRIKPSIQTC